MFTVKNIYVESLEAILSNDKVNVFLFVKNYILLEVYCSFLTHFFCILCTKSGLQNTSFYLK